jgi:hypothetical protein
MPIYQFAIRREHDPDPEIRWRHLPDQETAHRFAKFLINEFASSGRHAIAAHTRLEVKDDAGSLLLSIPFSQAVQREA